MNILLTNDDGPNTIGLRILKEAVKTVWPNAKLVTMTPDVEKMGQGLAITPAKHLEDLKLEEKGIDDYVLHGTPADVVYLAFCRMEKFLPKGHQWDLVLSGVNHGANVGLSILHSGTVGQCMLANSVFNCQAIAFSQELDVFKPTKDWTGDELNQAYTVSSKLVQEYLRTRFFLAETECRNVNFPAGPNVKTFVVTKPAPYQNFTDKQIPNLPPTANLKDDIQLLSKGYVTISELALSVLPELS